MIPLMDLYALYRVDPSPASIPREPHHAQIVEGVYRRLRKTSYALLRSVSSGVR